MNQNSPSVLVRDRARSSERLVEWAATAARKQLLRQAAGAPEIQFGLEDEYVLQHRKLALGYDTQRQNAYRDLVRGVDYRS